VGTGSREGGFVGDRVHLCKTGDVDGWKQGVAFCGDGPPSPPPPLRGCPHASHTPPRQRPCPHPTVVWSTTLRGSSAGRCTPTTSAAWWLRPPSAPRAPTLPFHLPLPRSCLAPAAAVVRSGAARCTELHLQRPPTMGGHDSFWFVHARAPLRRPPSRSIELNWADEDGGGFNVDGLGLVAVVGPHLDGFRV
jgi:hypothetical protein